MKKMIAFILAMILTLSFCVAVSAINIENTYTYGDLEVIFDENSEFSDTMKQNTVYYLVNGDDGISTYNLLCTLFGHKETVEAVGSISHKVSPTNPRCLKQIWEVTGCTRCEEALGMELLGETYITCCPED